MPFNASSHQIQDKRPESAVRLRRFLPAKKAKEVAAKSPEDILLLSLGTKKSMNDTGSEELGTGWSLSTEEPL